jgi:hypothetical protein
MDEINHQVGSDLVAIVSIATGVKALYSSARGLLSAAVKSVGKLSSNLSKLIARYTKEGYEIIEDGGKYFAKKGDTLIELGEGAAKGGSLVDQIDNVIAKLANRAKYELSGTGKYGGANGVGGHHPLAKSAFKDNFPTEAAFNQYADEAFSVSSKTLDEVSGINKVHNSITGQQRSLYIAWKKANPNAKLTIDDMAHIEIQAMKNANIPEDVATGWVVKALERLKEQGVAEIKNIPWNGIN